MGCWGGVEGSWREFKKNPMLKGGSEGRRGKEADVGKERESVENVGEENVMLGRSENLDGENETDMMWGDESEKTGSVRNGWGGKRDAGGRE